MAEWRKDLLPCPFCGNPPCYQFQPNPNGPKYPGHHEIWCESLDCDVGVEVSDVDLAEAERLWNRRRRAEIEQGTTRALHDFATDYRKQEETIAALVKALETVADAKMPGEARRIAVEALRAVVSTPGERS